jgi:predicted RND superfamily exporter protein
MNVIIYCRDKTTQTIDIVFKRVNKFLREESRFGLRQQDMKREGFDRFVYWLDGFFREQEEPIPAKPKIEGSEDVYYRLAGGTVGVQAAINECLTLYQIWTFVLALATVLVLCMFIFGSLFAGVIITLPLLLSNVLAFTFMAFNKETLALTTATLPVASVGIGLGVDYGIYLVSRIIEEFKSSGNLEQAIVKALGTTGKAIVYIAVTLVCGIAFWFLSKMMFQALMGLLLAIILLFNMLGALFIIPSAIALFKPRFIMKHQK